MLYLSCILYLEVKIDVTILYFVSYSYVTMNNGFNYFVVSKNSIC